MKSSVKVYYQNLVDHFAEYGLNEIFKKARFGFERESLRIRDSHISQCPHPPALGSSLCNKFITTDFSEAQLELITPTLESSKKCIEFLEHIHHFVSLNLDNEILWPISYAPPIISDEEIKIAKFGNSNAGLFKYVYRKGLARRYGKLMQTISGFHFNYSLPLDVWENLKTQHSKQINPDKSIVYLNMIRNFTRINWLILYLFGSSPYMNKRFLNGADDEFKEHDEDTIFLPYATSLRMSEYGYCNLNRRSVNISMNSLNQYIDDLRSATLLEDLSFREYSDHNHAQLNSNILQIEDEYYANARVKSNHDKFRRMSSNLLASGVDFLELRSLDLDPFCSIGVDPETILFLEILMLYCLITPCEHFSNDQIEEFSSNDLRVAKHGRQSGINLNKDKKEISLKEWGKIIIYELSKIVEKIDDKDHRYSNMIKSQQLKLEYPDLTLSGKLMEDIISSKKTYLDYGLEIGEMNLSHYEKIRKSSNPHWDKFILEASRSIQEQSDLEEKIAKKTFEEFKDDYFS